MIPFLVFENSNIGQGIRVESARNFFDGFESTVVVGEGSTVAASAGKIAIIIACREMDKCSVSSNFSTTNLPVSWRDLQSPSMCALHPNELPKRILGRRR